MKIFYSDYAPLPLPQGHRFPAQKYSLLRRRVAQGGFVSLQDMLLAEPASDEQLLLVHTPAYLRQVKTGQLSSRQLRRIGLPWSPELVERARRSVGSTIAACRSALDDRIAVSLSGGTHHAYPDHGQGFCVFNDVAVAVRVLQSEGRVNSVLILDLDVHQGNGTAAIFAEDPKVFTFSMHGAKNFPYRKEQSDLDIGLPDGAGDQAYLEALTDGMARSLLRPDLVIYLAGADPYKGDTLGRLSLTKAGLEARDNLVLQACLSRRAPLAILMSGGYAQDIEDTVDIHFRTVSTAAALAARCSPDTASSDDTIP